MLQLTKEQELGIRNAVKEFCEWQGSACIMFDEKDHSCWTDVFFDDNTWKEYHEDTIYSVYSKGSFLERNGRTSQDGIISIIKGQLYKNKMEPESVWAYYMAEY